MVQDQRAAYDIGMLCDISIIQIQYLNIQVSRIKKYTMRKTVYFIYISIKYNLLLTVFTV